MESILKFLQQLDLSEIEAKLYLNLLKSGPASVRDLAETIDIKRTTAYFYIDQLAEKGLVMKLVKGSKKLVAANPPQTLDHLVEKKVASAKLVEESFPDILQTLAATLPQENITSEAEITYYKGKNGVKKIYEDVLKANEIRSFVNIEEISSVFPENFQLFDNALTSNPDIMMYEIVEDSPEARERSKHSGMNQKYFYKFSSDSMKIKSTDILIYDGKVGFINLKDNMHGVILRNDDLYSNFKSLFDFIWRILPDA